jgi:hypothetical protein
MFTSQTLGMPAINHPDDGTAVVDDIQQGQEGGREISAMEANGLDVKELHGGTIPACKICGSQVTAMTHGSGPHFARLQCAKCGRFIRWLARPSASESMAPAETAADIGNPFALV